MAHLLIIAKLELLAVSRLKWIRLLTVAFGLLAAAAACSAGAAGEVAGADGFARTTMTLVPVVLILVPLAALMLGVSGQSVASGSESFLFGQPAERDRAAHLPRQFGGVDNRRSFAEEGRDIRVASA